MWSKRLLIIIFSSMFVSCYHQARIQEKVIEKPVYIKCQIPEVPKSTFTIDNSTSYPVKLKAILDYLFDLKRENELLREAINSCK